MKILKFTKPYRLKDFKFSLLISVLALTCLGIMVIGSAKQSVQGRQIIGLAIGLIANILMRPVAEKHTIEHTVEYELHR